MNEQLQTLTRSLTKQPGAAPTMIEKVMAALGVKPPADYIAFLRASNGAEGFMPNGRYLMLEPVEQLVPCNEPYGLGSSSPGLVTFGSDGGMTLFAFDIRRSPIAIVAVDATCMENGPVTQCGDTFVEFLEYLESHTE